ncbi:MAG: acetyl-CoA decarbonylase/synthase complex subunit delta [Planctomycetes bacterium]|nr:acetyl-CoA decarbonylase/synthase complex subunit delta [Planctomycetota bacterium]
MAVPDVKENFSGTINEVTIGATSEEGGTRTSTVTIGGETGYPMLGFEAEYPHPPAFALEISTAGVEGWHDECRKHLADVAGDLGAWAAKCEEWGADMICLCLDAAHPDNEGRSPQQCADDVKRVLEATGLPLLVWGTDVDEVDNNVLPKCTQAAAGENCLFGTAKEDNYRTIAASCLADNHKVLAEAPSDINLSKQLHILLRDVGVDLADMVMHPTTGALGFGMVYIYTTIERGRIAALSGDRLLQQPVLVNIGKEIGRVKEAVSPAQADPQWGSHEVRAPLWESASAISYVESGAELLVLRNPEALRQAKTAIESMWP